MTISTFEASKKICELGKWKISNLKLQKILYIAHKVFLGRNGLENPLIDENYEAWDYGPVVSSLYFDAKMFGREPIERSFFWHTNDVKNTPESDLIEEAVQHLLPLSAGQLIAITHKKNGAWYNYYEPNKKHIIIPNQAIWDEYRKTSGDE